MMYECKVFKPGKDGRLELDYIVTAKEVSELMWERAQGNQNYQKAMWRSRRKKYAVKGLCTTDKD